MGGLGSDGAFWKLDDVLGAHFLVTSAEARLVFLVSGCRTWWDRTLCPPQPTRVRFCTGGQRFPPGPEATRASVSLLSKASQCKGVSGKARGNQLLVSFPRGQTDTLSPPRTCHMPGDVGLASAAAAPMHVPARGPASSVPGASGAWLGATTNPGTRGQSEWAVTVPCAGCLGSEEEALLDVEEGSGKVRGHSWAGSGRDRRGTGLGDH